MCSYVFKLALAKFGVRTLLIWCCGQTWAFIDFILFTYFVSFFESSCCISSHNRFVPYSHTHIFSPFHISFFCGVLYNFHIIIFVLRFFSSFVFFPSFSFTSLSSSLNFCAASVSLSVRLLIAIRPSLTIGIPLFSFVTLVSLPINPFASAEPILALD